MEKIKKLILLMLKVGMIGFGGGNALIPMLEQTAVVEGKMISEDAFDEDVVIASITPGALPVEIAAGIGRRYIGTKGLLLGGIAMALPGVALTIFFVSVITVLDMSLLLQLRYIAVGVMAFICCLLTNYIAETEKQYKEHRLSKNGTWVSFLVVILTCGKSLYQILGIERASVFSLATIHIYLMAFFLLFYTGNKKSFFRFCVGGGVCVLYILCVGNIRLIQSEYARFGIVICMLVLGIYGFVGKKKSHVSLDRKMLLRASLEIGWILVVALTLTVAAVLVVSDSALFLGYGFLSTLMSFGGGDAYLTVADGLFVDTGMISENEFYNYLVPIVNILPGSILCKTLSGIGYFIGFSAHGNVWEGVLIALAGFFVSLLVSCGVFDLILCFYASFKDFYFIKGIRMWIRPIVSGLMVTVMLSLVWQNIQLGKELMIENKPVILMFLIYAADLLLIYKVKTKKSIVVSVSSMISLIGCNLMLAR